MTEITNVQLDESPASSDTIMVGVYGTLRKGYRAYGMIAETPGFKFVGNFNLPDFQMYHLGGFPGIVKVPDARVELEVYQLKNSTLPRLDGYEGTPYLYRRYSGLIGNEKVYFYVYNWCVSGFPAIDKWI